MLRKARETGEAKQSKGEGGKKTKLKDTLLVGERKKPTGPKLEEAIEDVNKKNAKAKTALLGYARFDVIANRDRMEFDVYNQRPIEPNHVHGILSSFQVNGVDRFNQLHAIPLVVNKSWLEPGSFIAMGDTPDLLPELKINDSAPRDWKVIAAGGQHRVTALGKWQTQIEKRLKEKKREESTILSTDTEMVGEDTLQLLNTEVRAMIYEMEAILANKGQWIVSIFDDSKVDTSLGLHLAKNETKYVYMESPMEGLVQRFKSMKAEGLSNHDVKPIPRSKGTSAKQCELLKQDYVWGLIQCFDDAGTQFWQSKRIIQFNQFYLTMFSSYGGIIAYLAVDLDHRLQMCFNTIDITETEVNTILKLLGDDSTKHKGQKKAGIIFDKLKTAECVQGAISSGIRDAIEECFTTFISNSSATDYFANLHAEQWVTFFDKYATMVPKKMCEKVKKMEARGGLYQQDDKVKKALSTCHLKAKIVLLYEHDPYSAFPFLSPSVFFTLCKHLTRISESILEMSSWFSPFVHCVKLFPKEWSPGSASADMIRAIYAHPSLIMDRRSDAVTDIIVLLFDKYAAFLNMESQLAALQIPARILKQGDLFKTFDMPNNRGNGEDEEDADDKDEGDLNSVDEEEPPNGCDPDNDPAQSEAREKRALRMAKEKEEAVQRLESLKWESSAAQRILVNSPKVTNPEPSRLRDPWTRKSIISTNAPSRAFRGQSLVTAHTWEWAATALPGSKARNMRILAGSSISEYCVIFSYRRSLLADQNGGGCFIRNSLESFTASYRIKVRVTSRQTKLTAQKPFDQSKSCGHTKVAVPMMWPDELKVPECKLTEFDVAAELQKHTRYVLRSRQQAELQRVVSMIELQRIAWQDTTNTASKGDRPAIDLDVHRGIEILVKVLNANAYAQRMGVRLRQSTNGEEGDSKEMLQVEFRGTSDVAKSKDNRKPKFFVFSVEEESAMLEKETVEVSAGTQDGDDDDDDMSNRSPAVSITSSSVVFDNPLRDILKLSSSGGGHQDMDLVRNPSPDNFDQDMYVDDPEETEQISHNITHLSVHTPHAPTTPSALGPPPVGRTDFVPTRRIPTPGPPYFTPIDDVRDEEPRVVTRKFKVQSHQKSPSPVPPPDAVSAGLAHDIPSSSNQPQSDRDKPSMSLNQSDLKRRRSTNSQTDGDRRTDRKRNRVDRGQVADTAFAKLASTTNPATYMA